MNTKQDYLFINNNTNLALLLAIEADEFLTKLEEANFNIFDDDFRKKKLFRMPY